MSFLKSLKTPRTRRKIFRVSLYGVVATYLIFCADFYIRQEWYLLEPNTDPTGGKPSELIEEEFELPSAQSQDGSATAIHYRKYVTTSMPAKGSIFYLHGNKGNMNKCEWEIEFLLKLGHDVWTMDYRGYGDSVGKISEEALKTDAMAVYDKIAAEVDAKSLVIWGRSFGSGVAASVAAAAEDKPEMLVLETPYWSLVDLVQQKCPIIPSVLFRYELPIHEFLMSANCPIHVIHGTLDEKIPSNSSERLLDLRDSNDINIKGHSIMCGMHNLRNEKTKADFEGKVTSILE